MKNTYLLLTFFLLFLLHSELRAEPTPIIIEDGLNDPLPSDPNFEAYDYEPETEVSTPLFSAATFSRMIRNELGDEDEVVPVLFDFLKKKTVAPAVTASATLQASEVDIDVYKRPKDFPEFLVVRADGKPIMVALVSTGRSSGATPVGRFRSFHYRNMKHRSSRHHNAPMPYANFYDGHRAFHGTVEENYANLGGPASAGCVRLQVSAAKKLWGLVNQFGRGAFETNIHKSGDNSFRDLSDYEAIAKSLEADIRLRDAAYAVFVKSKVRSPDWPSGYFK